MRLLNLTKVGVKMKKTKKDSKRPPSLPPSSPVQSSCDCWVPIVMVIGAAVLIGGLFWLVSWVNSPKFSVGDCVVNRSFTFMKVNEVGEYSYRFTSLKIDTWSNGWTLESSWLSEDFIYKESYTRDIDWADKLYTKVPCNQVL